MSEETKTGETVEEKTDDTQEEVAEEVDIKEVIAAAIAELKLAHEQEMDALREQLNAEFKAKILEMFTTPVVPATEVEPDEEDVPETIDDLFDIVEE